MTIVTQPGNTPAGDPISPFPEVRISDNVGNAVSGASITFREEGGYTLDGGTITRTSNSSGIVVFNDLIIESAGQYTLVFDALASGVPDVSSDSFTINAGAGSPANTTATVSNGTAGQQTDISINVEDEFNNPVGGAAGDLSVVVTGANSDTPVVSETTTTGIYTASYTPINSGTDNISIDINSQGISGSPFSSNVATSGISSSVSSVAASVTSLQVGNSSTVSVLLRDDVGNAISGLPGTEFTVDASGSATVGSVTETSTDGTYQFNVGNTTSQTVTVSVVVSSVALDDTPQIVFTAGNPADLRITTNPGNAIAGTAIPGPPSVIIEDQYENPVPNINVTVSEQGGEPFASGTATIQTDATGIADFNDLRIDVIGQYNLVFSSAGLNNQTSNAFDVSAGPADAGQTTAAVPNGSAGDPTVITITVKDAFGNSVTDAAGDLAVSVSGANTGATVDAITGNGDGTYTTGYTPTSTGDDTITITLNGTGISGSPFTSTVITSDASNVDVAVEPAQTVAGQPVAGPPAVLVTDNLNNSVSGIDVVASLSAGSFTSGTLTVASDGSGESVFDDLVITQAGSYTIDFNAQGVTTPATTTAFDVIPAAASALVIDSGNNQTATVTQTLASQLTVQVTDQFGNAVAGEDVNFAITATPTGATGQNISAATVPTDVDGLAATSLTLGNVSGDYQVTASGTGFGSVVFTATAEPGAATSFSFETITSPQVAGEAFSITITARDSEDNLANSYSGSASLSTSAGTIAPLTTNFSNGSSTVNVSVTNAGIDQTITAEDGSIMGTSNTFNVESGGVSATNSTASASPVSLEAGQNSTLEINLRDGSGNPIGGVSAGNFDISLTGDATLGTLTEPTSGTYTASITNQTAELVTVSVTVNTILLNDSPQIEFTAGAVSNVTILSGNNQTGTVAEQLTSDFVVEATDVFNNPVSSVQVDFAIDQIPAGTTGESLTNMQILTGSLGRAATRLTLGDIPGTYTVDATVAGAGTVTFSAQAEIGEASSMTVTTPPSETTAGTSISPAPAVTITDDAGNAIGGVNVSVSEQGGYTFDSGTLSSLTDANGVASFDGLVINTAGNYTLEFDADAPAVSSISSTPFDVVPAAGDPANSTANVPDGAAGDPTTITISVWDQFNNAVTGASGALSVSFVTGPNSGSSFSTITDNGNGTYTTSYTPTALGEDEISITLNGTNIAGTTYFSTVSTSDVSASNSNVSATPGTLQAGSNSLVTVEVRDGSNNLISGLVSTDFSITVSGNGSAGPISETSPGGTYQFNVSNETAEQVNVSVTATGTTLTDSPTIIFTAASADLMLITQQPLLSEAGQPIIGPPTVRITDQYGNRVPNVEVTLSEQSGQAFSTSSTSVINTNSQGLAIFDNVAIEPVGDYNLVFSVAGITNRTSNLFRVEASAPVASQTTASVPNGSAGVRTQISITARDAFGNRVEGAASLIGVQISGANNGSSLEGILDNGGGVYTTAYTPLSTGTDQVAIDIDGIAIPNSPFASVVTTSDADVVALNQQPLGTTAGNTIDGPPSVLVTDEFDNTVSGIEVTVRESGGAGFDAGNLTVAT